MHDIFPPFGKLDASRFDSLKKEEREYMWFCLEFCDMVLARRPAHVEALEAAANHFTALGYYSDGLGLDRRLAELMPENPGVLYNLACSLALVGETNGALDELARAVRCGYDDFRHMAADEDLESLHGDSRFLDLVGKGGKKKA